MTFLINFKKSIQNDVKIANINVVLTLNAIQRVEYLHNHVKMIHLHHSVTRKNADSNLSHRNNLLIVINIVGLFSIKKIIFIIIIIIELI